MAVIGKDASAAMATKPVQRGIVVGEMMAQTPAKGQHNRLQPTGATKGQQGGQEEWDRGRGQNAIKWLLRECSLMARLM